METLLAIGVVVIVILLAYIAWVVSGKRQEMKDARDTKRLHEGLKEASEILQARGYSDGKAPWET